jgi:hypothetical protein
MTPHTGHPGFTRSRHHTADVAAIPLVLTGPGLARYGVVMTVRGYLVVNSSGAFYTAQGILGYVKVASGPASFQIKAYSAAPPAAQFRLPAGAKVTTSHHVTN